ncbi:MAG: RNA methyltransferase [Candidatus Shapirobacteria bacterium]|jgi:tRNA (guanosine-2'-O-)-methyltransferase
MKEMENRQEKIERVIGNRREGVVVLEDIHDPHNAAAVWRSCDAFGWQKVYLIFDKEIPFNPKKVGKASSSSANKWLTFKIFKSTKECFEELKKDGFEIYATVLDEGSKGLWETKFRNKKTAIALGNEHRGLSETAVKLADRKIYIPMRGMVQSLNLSVTAGIVLAEAERQRNSDPRSWMLDLREKEELLKRWR